MTEEDECEYAWDQYTAAMGDLADAKQAFDDLKARMEALAATYEVDGDARWPGWAFAKAIRDELKLDGREILPGGSGELPWIYRG